MNEKQMDRAGELPVERRVGERRVAAEPVAHLYQWIGDDSYHAPLKQIARSVEELEGDIDMYPESWKRVGALFTHAVPSVPVAPSLELVSRVNAAIFEAMNDRLLAYAAQQAVKPFLHEMALPVAAELPASDELRQKLKLTDWTDLENYGAKFCEAFNRGVDVALDEVAAAPALPVVPEGTPMIGKLLDAFSDLETLWGLNEPGALVRHSDVFRMLVKAGKEQAAAAPVLSVGLPSQPTEQSGSTGTNFERMFMAACDDLGAINEELGLDPDDGGAEPIIEAIRELKAKIESSPIAEPDTATQAPSESIDCPEFRALLPDDLSAFRRTEIIDYIHSWHQRATQAAKPLTDEDIDKLWNSLDGKALIAGENQPNWNAVIRKAFARAIHSHLKGE